MAAQPFPDALGIRTGPSNPRAVFPSLALRGPGVLRTTQAGRRRLAHKKRDAAGLVSPDPCRPPGDSLTYVEL